jgi:membrane-bound inhibitor of C-type lysozyme
MSQSCKPNQIQGTSEKYMLRFLTRTVTYVCELKCLKLSYQEQYDNKHTVFQLKLSVVVTLNQLAIPKLPGNPL